MAEDLVVNQLLQVTYYCRGADQVSQTVRFWRVTALAGTGATLEEAASVLSTDIGLAIRNCLPSSASYLGLKAQIIQPTRLLSVVATDNAGEGEVSSPLAPKMASAIISWKTRLAGKRWRGRSYIPFPSEDANDADGNPAAAYLLFVNEVAEQWNEDQFVGAGGNSATLQPVHYSRAQNSIEPIAGYVIRTRWGTQRRRSAVAGGDAVPF